MPDDPVDNTNSAVLIRRERPSKKVSTADNVMFGTKRFSSRHSGQSKLPFAPNCHVLMRKKKSSRRVPTARQSCADDDSSVTSLRRPDRLSISWNSLTCFETFYISTDFSSLYFHPTCCDSSFFGETILRDGLGRKSNDLFLLLSHPLFVLFECNL